jgi:hypothetical protein
MVVLRSLEEDLKNKVNLLHSSSNSSSSKRTAASVVGECKHGGGGNTPSTITDATFMLPSSARIVAIKKHCKKCSPSGGGGGGVGGALSRAMSVDNFSRPKYELNHSKVELINFFSNIILLSQFA